MTIENNPHSADGDDNTLMSGSHAGNAEEELNGGVRGRSLFQSIHRRNLNHINKDETLSKRHSVPEVESTRKPFSAKVRDAFIDENSSKKTRDDWIGTFLPCYKWLRVYDWRTKLFTDILAGLAVGVMVVPQSMSYAKLAGLPVEYGLYSALFPIWAYSLFGSSRQLAIGPVALVSLMLGTGLSNQMDKLGIPKDADNYVQVYTTLAIQTSFLVGVLNLIMGLLRLGFVTIFMSHAVISGFISGASIIIGLSQLKGILGVNADGDNVEKILANVFQSLNKFNYKSFLMGSFSLAALIILKEISKRLPQYKWLRAIGPIFVTVVTISVTYGFNLGANGIPTVSYIPQGFPDFTVGLWFPMADFGALMQTAVAITIIGFMESIAIAKQLAAKHKYEIESSMELIGLGVANIVASMSQAYPVTGSFSRSAVNSASGAQSGVSGIVTAFLVGIVLLLLTDVFEYMPLAVLSAIVISGVINLFDYTEAIYLWKVHKFDFGVWMCAFLGVTLLGVEMGLAISVGVSLLLIIYESAFPHTAVLGRLPGSNVYRNVKQYPQAERYDGLVMVRIDAPIYFANTDNIRTKLGKYEKAAKEELASRGDAEVKFLILDLSPVSHVDSSALHILHEMISGYKDRGIQLVFANPSVNVMDLFVKSQLADEVGREHIFVSIQDAVKWCLDHLDSIAVSVHEVEKDLEHDVEKAEVQSEAEA